MMKTCTSHAPPPALGKHGPDQRALRLQPPLQILQYNVNTNTYTNANTNTHTQANAYTNTHHNKLQIQNMVEMDKYVFAKSAFGLNARG